MNVSMINTKTQVEREYQKIITESGLRLTHESPIRGLVNQMTGKQEALMERKEIEETFQRYSIINRIYQKFGMQYVTNKKSKIIKFVPKRQLLVH